MNRADYVIKRLAFALMTVFVAITVNFLLFRALPGNAVANLSRAPHASPELRAALTHEFGLDLSLWQQYVLYLDQLVFHANLGVSFTNSQPVTTNLWNDLKTTIPMVTVGTLVAILLGIVTGFLSAWRRGGITDLVSTNLAIVFYALPTQFIGMVLILLFAKYLPTSGRCATRSTTTSPHGSTGVEHQGHRAGTRCCPPPRWRSRCSASTRSSCAPRCWRRSVRTTC